MCFLTISFIALSVYAYVQYSAEIYNYVQESGEGLFEEGNSGSNETGKENIDENANEESTDETDHTDESQTENPVTEETQTEEPIKDEKQAKRSLQVTNEVYRNTSIKINHDKWGIISARRSYSSENLVQMISVCKKEAKFKRKQLAYTKKFEWRSFIDITIRRQFFQLSIIGVAALPNYKLEKWVKINFKMEKNHEIAKLCDYNDSKMCNVTQPKVNKILSTSNNTAELKHYWVAANNVSVNKSKSLFFSHVKLANEAAKLNNFTHHGEFMLHTYESADIEVQFENLWNEIKPIYLEIHAYVRYKLQKIYGNKIISNDGPIPIHLLGDMWSRTWVNIAKQTLPCPKKKLENVTQEMIQQNYTAIKIFKISEQFFVSLNLSVMPKTFWKNSILEKPKNKEHGIKVDHASAWDMGDGRDFRIKQHTSVDFKNFITAHNKMSHIQYFIQYKHQPFAFRREACDGFLEGIGGAISLSVSSQTHLQKIGLFKGRVDNYMSNLNHLYTLILDKIIFLSYAYTVHLFRMNVFKGKITVGNCNCEWWKLFEKYQGIEPPVDRNKFDFDMASNFHIYANIPTIRYFVSSIIQFQFHKALSIEAGLYDLKDTKKLLHKCDIFQSIKAGILIKKMCQLGSSKPWREVLKVITGETKISVNGILEFFKPIIDYIKTKNKKKGLYIGWKQSTKSFGCSA